MTSVVKITYDNEQLKSEIVFIFIFVMSEWITLDILDMLASI